MTPEQIRESFEKILQNKKRYYDSLQEFLEAYFDLVDDTYNRSEQVRVVNGRIKKIRQSFQMVDERGDIEADHYEQCEDEPEEEYEEDFDAVDQHRDARSSERSGSVQHQRYQGSYQQRNQRDQTVSGNDSNRRDRNHDKYSGRDHKWGGGNQFQRNQDMARRPEREMDQRKCWNNAVSLLSGGEISHNRKGEEISIPCVGNFYATTSVSGIASISILHHS